MSWLCLNRRGYGNLKERNFRNIIHRLYFCAVDMGGGVGDENLRTDNLLDTGFKLRCKFFPNCVYHFPTCRKNKDTRSHDGLRWIRFVGGIRFVDDLREEGRK